MFEDHGLNVNKKILVGVLTLVVVSGLSFSLGARYGSFENKAGAGFLFAGANSDEAMPKDVDFAPLWKVWNLLDTKYVATYSTSTVITPEDKLWGAIEGLTASVGDPYTVFLPPEDNEIFADDISGNFEGVGMEIGIRNGLLTVIAPLKGTPAEAAGILAGDTVLSIDGEPTDRLTIDGAVKLIRGPGGTEVVLGIGRKGENQILEIGVVRDVIKIPTIATILRPDGIFVIELYNFSAVSSNLFRTALREFTESGSHKLILDLRGNPGGFLDAAVDMASWFLPAGEVVLREDFGDNIDPQIHRSKGYDVFNDTLEMVILINQGSASASEILAGALSQHGVATLVGDTSFGKGSVQELVDITEKTSLKVTIARWLTPNSTSISEGGLAPDYKVERTFEDIEADRDPQLQKAVDLLRAR